MSDEDEVRRLTAEEIGLLKEIARWRRNHDVTFFLHRNAGWWTRGWMSWDEPRSAEGIRRSVTFELDKEAGLGEVIDYYTQSFRWHEVDSVMQAVDVLVAYGYLPPRFSSAYRAGWDALAMWRAVENPDPAMYEKAAHDADAMGFPAVEPVW